MHVEHYLPAIKAVVFLRLAYTQQIDQAHLGNICTRIEISADHHAMVQEPEEWLLKLATELASAMHLHESLYAVCGQGGTPGLGFNSIIDLV